MEKLIRAMIARGEVLEAVNTLIELLPEGELSNEMVLHSSRLVSTRRNLRMNLISFSPFACDSKTSISIGRKVNQ